LLQDELASTKPYRLPDGRIVDLGAERHRAAEVLFNPSLVGLEYRGAHETLTECIFKADLDLRRELLASIVLAGGSSLTPGFGERLVGEIKTIASKHTRMGGPPMPGDEALDAAMKIRVAAPPNRTNLVWVGGSILASLAAFKTMWIKKSRFDEVGAALAMSKDAMY
jgi:centractin